MSKVSRRLFLKYGVAGLTIIGVTATGLYYYTRSPPARLPLQPSIPPLSYAIVSFNRASYRNARENLRNLKALGFRWVTFVPTFMVNERSVLAPSAAPLLINVNSTPSFEEIRELVIEAVRMGFNVKIEPHLDFEYTLMGIEEDWRIRMYFDPVEPMTMMHGYENEIIDPLFRIIVDASRERPMDHGDNFPCFALTLGSEIDVSLYEFTSGWQEMYAILNNKRTINGLGYCRTYDGDVVRRLAFGHTVNHDSLSHPEYHISRWINIERENRSIAFATTETIEKKRAQVARYLASLDYASFSFYSAVSARPVGPGEPLFKWRSPVTDADISAVAAAFLRNARQIITFLPKDASFDIGEFGLGGPDPKEPQLSRPDLFFGEDGVFDEKTRYLRQKFYLGFLRFLENNASLFSADKRACSKLNPVTFWTVNQYDFLNIFKRSFSYGSYEFEPNAFYDEILEEAVKRYNQKTYDN